MTKINDASGSIPSIAPPAVSVIVVKERAASAIAPTATANGVSTESKTNGLWQ